MVRGEIGGTFGKDATEGFSVIFVIAGEKECELDVSTCKGTGGAM